MGQVLIADGHPVTRHAVRILLESEGHTIAGEAEDGLDALRLGLEQPADLLILDIDLSRLNGLDVMARLRARGVNLPVLAFSAQDSEHIVGRFLQGGASGFVSKHDDLRELSLAVAMLLRGRSYFPMRLLGNVNLPEVRSGERERVASLSNRELSVLYFLASGRNNHQIAHELTISEKTVSTYRTRLQHKLNLHSLAELIDFARRNALVTAPQAEPERAAPDSDELVMLRSLVDSLPDALYVRDTAGRLAHANLAFLRLYDVHLEDVLGTRAMDVDWYAPAQAELLHQYFLQAVAAELAFARDIELRIHGQRRVLHHWGKPYRDAQGRLLGMICGSADITGRQDRLRAIEADKQQAELSNRQKLNFLVRASNEFSVPLGAMHGLLEMVLQRATLQPADREALEWIDSTSRDLLELTADLRQIARLESGEEQAQRVPLHLEPLLREALAALEAPISAKGLKLELQASPEVDHALLGDPLLLRKILDYLLAYLIRETAAGTLCIALHGQVEGERLAVRLNAAPLLQAAEDPQAVYSLEELAADAARQILQEAPVGLIVAKRLVGLLQGELVLASPPGQGTTASVHLMLPLAPISTL
ncbi:response regulator [Pseudomonas sp. NY15435]|uniref:response regulator n=1 Tax=Pseudomonas sp. NY15435 TaxID=3400358 RepID=UPI003A857B20